MLCQNGPNPTVPEYTATPPLTLIYDTEPPAVMTDIPVLAALPRRPGSLITVSFSEPLLCVQPAPWYVGIYADPAQAYLLYSSQGSFRRTPQFLTVSCNGATLSFVIPPPLLQTNLTSINVYYFGITDQNLNVQASSIHVGLNITVEGTLFAFLHPPPPPPPPFLNRFISPPPPLLSPPVPPNSKSPPPRPPLPPTPPDALIPLEGGKFCFSTLRKRKVKCPLPPPPPAAQAAGHRRALVVDADDGSEASAAKVGAEGVAKMMASGMRGGTRSTSGTRAAAARRALHVAGGSGSAQDGRRGLSVASAVGGAARDGAAAEAEQGQAPHGS